MMRCHGRLHYDRKFQIFLFLIGYIDVNKGVFCLIISYLQIKSYNVLNYNNCSTDWSFPLNWTQIFPFMNRILRYANLSYFIYMYQCFTICCLFIEFIEKVHEMYQSLVQTQRSPRDPVVVPSGSDDASVHQNNHHPVDGVDAMQYFRAVFPLCDRSNFRYNPHFIYNRIGGVMVSVLASSAVDHGFETLLGQTKDYKISICCFST